MRRRSRTRRVLKWVGLVVSLALLCAWGASLPWQITYRRTNLEVIVAGGAVATTLANPYTRTGWSFVPVRHVFMGWWPSVGPRFRYPNSPKQLVIPLWIPLLTIAIPTAILWHRDRRRGIARSAGMI